jgi:hypothetical protein
VTACFVLEFDEFTLYPGVSPLANGSANSLAQLLNGKGVIWVFTYGVQIHGVVH